MKQILKYLAKLLADRNGIPSAKRHACALFVITAVALAFCGFGAELVAVFLAAALGENIATIFERGKHHGNK
ncbi:hypothetical protein LJC18_02255 [Lachnospiraceae bacterium OttesenSCG-928-E19]|nr:hypothetical protein [Lachnospiraceae bacterium OttesenSCG-928-E19]